MKDRCHICGDKITPLPPGCPEEWNGMCVMCIIRHEVVLWCPVQLMAYINYIMGGEHEHELVVRVVELREMTKLSRPLVRNNPMWS